MIRVRLLSQIRKALSVAGVWVVPIRGSEGTPPICLPEYGWIDLWPISPEASAWHLRAMNVGLRVATVSTVHEALLQVSAWELASKNEPKPPVVRAKYLRAVK